MLHFDVTQSCFIVSYLRVTETLILSTLDMSVVSLRILMIIYFVSGEFRSTRIICVCDRSVIQPK